MCLIHKKGHLLHRVLFFLEPLKFFFVHSHVCGVKWLMEVLHHALTIFYFQFDHMYEDYSPPLIVGQTVKVNFADSHVNYYFLILWPDLEKYLNVSQRMLHHRYLQVFYCNTQLCHLHPRNLIRYLPSWRSL